MILLWSAREATEHKAILVGVREGLSGSNEQVSAICGEGIGAVRPGDFNQRLPLCELPLDVVVLLALQAAELGEEASRAEDGDADGLLDEVRAPGLPLIEVEGAGVGTEGLYGMEVDGDGVLANLVSPLVIEGNAIGGIEVFGFFGGFRVLVPEAAAAQEGQMLDEEPLLAALVHNLFADSKLGASKAGKALSKPLVVRAIRWEVEGTQDVTHIDKLDGVVFGAAQVNEGGGYPDGD